MTQSTRETVYICRTDDVVQVGAATCKICKKDMQDAGWFEQPGGTYEKEGQ